MTADREPSTEAGRTLAARFPFTFTEQTCCPYPHGEDSGPDIHPRHKRASKTTYQPDEILAIEREVRSDLARQVAGLVADDFHDDPPFDFRRGFEAAIKPVLAILAGTDEPTFDVASLIPNDGLPDTMGEHYRVVTVCGHCGVVWSAILAGTDATPEPQEGDAAPGGTVDGHVCRCGGSAYRPNTVTGRRFALRCSSCHAVVGRCKCQIGRAHGLAALDALNYEWHNAESGGMTVADFRAHIDAIRSILAATEPPPVADHAEQMRLRAEVAEAALRDGAIPAMRFAARRLAAIEGERQTADDLRADADKIEIIARAALQENPDAR